MDQKEIQQEDDLLIINDVARAVEEGEFVPFVQPIFDLPTRAVAGAEVLARWTLPEDGTLVPAAAFIPSLERTHTICGLDWYIAEAICTFLSKAEGPVAKARVALNISSQHVEDSEFASKLAATVNWHAIDHGQVSVELSAELIDTDDRVKGELVPSLTAAGFGVIADNFAGDMDLLRAMADKGIRVVKVAAALWRDGDPQVLKNVVGVARELGIALVAENVENDEERAAVLTAGFAEAQGYGLAHPMSLEDFKALLEQ